ncbi:TIGR02285 family protein [Pseudoalteromonas sp. SMS1]|uniref:TIGR02285 family protein n=1 Tax=Pseudoalteromonas sp. SMS1 TaxID=2908894 RepID=UPI001F1F1456|nr:TIGR02285 family protein [Pseudoalteromonas sp. SMS1]MCF2857993.1 TIGR02285 family protein [Pseudoalteromonas sp. SMS1]
MRKTLFLLLMLIGPAKAKSIDWIITDFPPYYMISDDLEGTGRDELVINLLHSHLPDYSENKIFFPASRAIRALSDKRKTYCMLSLYKTRERQKFMHFSDSYATVGLSPTLAISNKTLAALNKQQLETVSLKQFIEKHNLVLGVAMQRSYGSVLDDIIKSLPKEQVLTRPGQDALESLTNMLIKKRVDAVIGYPSEHHYIHKLTHTKAELSQLLLDDISPLAYGYVGCTKNENGKEIIGVINETIPVLTNSQAFKSIMVKWLPNYLETKLDNLLKGKVSS